MQCLLVSAVELVKGGLNLFGPVLLLLDQLALELQVRVERGDKGRIRFVEVLGLLGARVRRALGLVGCAEIVPQLPRDLRG